ncbi:MAG: bifunctional folylpolyglutamate synthase/dihydrofolate synthase [Gaiellales bacterium]
MNQAEEYIASLELFGMQFGLERMHRLLEVLGHPEREFDAVHVVGTNGKSSTVRFAEALLEAEGVRTGAYLSPHITDFRERIRLHGDTIDTASFQDAVLAVRDAAAGGVTQFEALTAAALLAFARGRVEWAVIEAGLGGRLDATNVLARSRVQVLTNVSLEHTRLLGTTREAIAREKLAVVPPGGVLVVGEAGWDRLAPQAAETRLVAVHGTFQDQNRAVALAAVEAALGRPVDPAPMSGVIVPGRLELLGGSPMEVWDGAHNPAGMLRLVAELPALLGDRRAVGVFAALEDKDVERMLETLREVCPVIVATRCSSARSLPASRVAAISGGPAFDDPVTARAHAIRLAGASGAVVVCGSLYLLHDLATRLPFAGRPSAPLH